MDEVGPLSHPTLALVEDSESHARLLDLRVENARLDGACLFHLNKDAVTAWGGKPVGELDGGRDRCGGCAAHAHASHGPRC